MNPNLPRMITRKDRASGRFHEGDNIFKMRPGVAINGDRIPVATTADIEAAIAAIDTDPTPFDAGVTTSDITLVTTDGRMQKIALTGATEARVFNPPTAGTEGDWLRVRVHSTTGDARTLAMDAAILIPSDSGITFPKALTQGKTYFIKLYNNGTAWELVVFIGGY